jgi:hypothetical protein
VASNQDRQFMCGGILIEVTFQLMYSELNTRDVYKRYKDKPLMQDMVFVLSRAFNSINYHYRMTAIIQDGIP